MADEQVIAKKGKFRRVAVWVVGAGVSVSAWLWSSPGVNALTALYQAVNGGYIKRITPRFAIQIPFYAQDVLRGESINVPLLVDNEETNAILDSKGYVCTLNGAPTGILISPVKETNCEFTVKNIAVAHPVGWPVEGIFDMSVDSRTVHTKSSSATLYFHDIERPSIEPDSLKWIGGKLRIEINIRRNRENADVLACEWWPADWFADMIVRGESCSAAFTDPTANPMPPISVEVTLKSGERPAFKTRSNDAAVHVPLWPGAEGSNNLAVDVNRTRVAAAAGTTTPSTGTVTSAAHVGGQVDVAGLVASLESYRDAERYDRLVVGLKGPAGSGRVSPTELLDLVGPLSGTLRVSAVSSLLLPRLATPVSVEEVTNIMKGFASADRAGIVHALAGCLSEPAEKGALLSGIFGADRQWAESALGSAGPCRLEWGRPK